MSLYRLLKWLPIACLAFAAARAVAEAPAEELNRAQELVFLGEHLRQTRQGQTLVYDFASRATGRVDKVDEVRMTVTGVVDEARRDLSFEFLSGEDRIRFPDTHGYRGNPVAVQFLERDIRDMAQHTGTPVAHFRNRIRKAFRTPQIVQTRATVGERQVDATMITVVPFTSDETLAAFDGYADKEYVFGYSEQVPGDLLLIRTRMATAAGDMVEEELHFRQTAEVH
ncbi:MAG: hypothetical protein H6953_03425 [Chromatiaceae bacterium]|nr:hypothetical protein [Gammaproteobacteria bacterium]MCP5304475.1 hypothetical protein [Chromatiaceae bacterium]MCP5314203.1 hypothetical protein [Chromatiaceae bacterium]